MLDILNPVFTNEDKAREHLERLTWPKGPHCPHCGEVENVHRLHGKSHRKGLIQCNSCLKNFTVTVGTVFERSKVPLNKWLLAAFLMSSSKKGMSAHQIHRMLGVTYKTAWFMMHRIREAMKDDGSPLGGPGKIVESDEAFVGGSAKKRLGGKVAPMKKVMTLVERDGRARSFHVANLNHNNIRGAIVTNVDRASTLMTDDARVYWPIGREFAGGHGTTLHANREFARPGGIHSNTAENFFSILKRGVVGTYHHWSPAHLHRYLAEFDFRYSHKDVTDAERSDELLKGIVGKRLTYRRTATLAA
jgi:transposase-like protein